MRGRNYQRYARNLNCVLDAVDPGERNDLLRGTGLHLSDLESENRLVSRTQELTLYRNLARHPRFGSEALRIGQNFSFSTMGAVGYAQQVSRTAREAIEIAKRYRCMTLPYMRWDVLVIGREVVHRLTDTENLGEVSPFLMELFLAFSA